MMMLIFEIGGITSQWLLLFLAPEVLCGEAYEKEVDMWSIGVITYILYVSPPHKTSIKANFFILGFLLILSVCWHSSCK